MKSRLPTGLYIVAVLQFVAPLLLPLDMLKAISPVLWGLVLALFALLGVYLLRRRAWARLATVFIQGFNIIVRLLILIGNVATKTSAGAVQVNVAMLSTFIVSMLLSGVLLYYVDLPDVQMVMA